MLYYNIVRTWSLTIKSGQEKERPIKNRKVVINNAVY